MKNLSDQQRKKNLLPANAVNADFFVFPSIFGKVNSRMYWFLSVQKYKLSGA